MYNHSRAWHHQGVTHVPLVIKSRFSLSSSQSLDNKPPPCASQWSTFSPSVSFLDLTTLLLIRFRHLEQSPFSLNQTVVPIRVQPLYSMASSIAHDHVCQEKFSFPLLHLLNVKKKPGVRSLGLHIRPTCNQALRGMFNKKKVDFDLHTVCFLWTSGDARGLGLFFMVCACAVGLRGNGLIRMRGTWGVVWWSAHVSTIPFTWLRRAKAFDPTAHASYQHAIIGIFL